LPRFSIVIPVLNSRATLEACLDSVHEAMQRSPDSELILMDHGSTDGSYEWLVSHYGPLAKVVQRKGGTIASLRNQGARLASGDFLCFIDSDCTIRADYLESAADVFQRVDCDATGCRCEIPSAPHWVEETWYYLHRKETGTDGYVTFINSGNLVVKKKAFDQVGGFDDRLQTDEDADLVQRLWASGFKVYEAHRVSAVHHGNPKSLVGFFRNELWRGTGMFSVGSRPYIDKVLIATLVHASLVLLGIAAGVLLHVSLADRLVIFLFLSLAVPAFAVVFRSKETGGIYRPVRSLLLYCTYFTAKAAALLVSLGKRGQSQSVGRD
jgi:glycosyltransferase involved in cell wall biosynthesis